MSSSINTPPLLNSSEGTPIVSAGILILILVLVGPIDSSFKPVNFDYISRASNVIHLFKPPPPPPENDVNPIYLHCKTILMIAFISTGVIALDRSIRMLIKRRNLRGIQRFIFSIQTTVTPTQTISTGKMECPICWDELREGVDNTVSLECMHVFHGDCMVGWCQSKIHTSSLKIPTCPICRTPLFTKGQHTADKFLPRVMESLADLGLCLEDKLLEYHADLEPRLEKLMKFVVSRLPLEQTWLAFNSNLCLLFS